MYESPIEILYGDMSRKIDDGIYAAIVNVGVNVDKDELVRALQYDRDQYDEGYKDGFKRGVEKFAERLKRRIGFCNLPNEVIRGYIDVLVKEIMEQ